MAMVGSLRFQLPPVEPCVRFSRTRLTDVLHRRCSTGARQARLGLGATTTPLRLIRPKRFPEAITHRLSVAATPLVALAHEQGHPLLRIGGDLVEGVGRVSIAEVPGPAAHEGVDVVHDEIDRRA